MQQPRPTPPPPQSSSVYASLYAQYLAYYRSMGYDPATAHQAAHSYASQAAAASSTNPSTADNPMIQQQQHYRHQQQPQYIKVQPKTSTTSAVAVNIPKSSTATTTTATAWPDSLKRYVASVFQLTRPHQKAAVEAELKLLIKQHSATLHSTDWDKMPMLK